MTSPVDHEEERRKEMALIVNNLDALSRTNRKSISHSASIMARLFYNLEESESATVDERLLHELRKIAYSNKVTAINDFAIHHLAKSFLHYVDGLITRRVTVLVPSNRRTDLATATSRAVADSASSSSADTDATGTAQVIDIIDLVFPKDDEADSTPMDVQVESTETQDANVSWKVVAGSYLCNFCCRLYPALGEMVMHAKICDAKIAVKTEEEEEEEVIQESLSTVARPALRRFDYAIRGLRTVEAKTCPYCEVEMASCHMVEHHSRRAHANERTAVFGCTECRRWCTTTMALIKHWSKMECPNGRITVRKPIEATEAKNQKRNVTQIRYACNTCGKGFFSRLGVKYHVDKVCESSMAIDVKKYIKEGTQFVSIETLKGFHLELVSSDPSSIPPCLTSFPRFQGALQPKQSPPSEKSL